MIKPLWDYVTLEVIEEKKDGLDLPDEVDQDVPNFGFVVLVAFESGPIKPGVKVLFKKHLFDEVTDTDGKKLLIGKEDAIIAIVE